MENIYYSYNGKGYGSFIMISICRFSQNKEALKVGCFPPTDWNFVK